MWSLYVATVCCFKAVSFSDTYLLCFTFGWFTQLTGSVRGAEERDFMFCRLFAVLCLLRSGVYVLRASSHLTYIINLPFINALSPFEQAGCCINDSSLNASMLDRLLELHTRKGWIRESCSEAMLLLLQQQCDRLPATAALLSDTLLPKVLALFDGATTVADMAAWQLMLRIGLQQLAEQHKDSFGVMLQQLLQKRSTAVPQFQISDLPAAQETILAATAGFPKVQQLHLHRAAMLLVVF